MSKTYTWLLKVNNDIQLNDGEDFTVSSTDPFGKTGLINADSDLYDKSCGLSSRLRFHAL